MLCDECKIRPASIHITKINNNKKVERHLCEECAEKLGEMKVAFQKNISVNDFLKGMFNLDFISDKPQNVSCPNCGMTYDDFSRGGKIGCSVCYQTFYHQLEPLIRRIHGTCSHTGKVPKRAGGSLALKQKLKQLRHQLDQLVGREEYEKAAKVRDEIRALEVELGMKN